MKYLLMLALLVPFWCGLPAQARTLADALMELYADPDPEISAGAMLLTKDTYAYPTLLPYVKQSIKIDDPPYVKAVKTFLTAKWEFDDKKSQLAFIRQFPATQEEMGDLIGFEGEVRAAAHSPLIDYLFNLAESEDHEVRQCARRKIRQAKPFADGWAGEQFDMGMRSLEQK